MAEQILQSTPFVEHLVCNLTCALAHDEYFVHTCTLILQENFGYMYDIILLKGFRSLTELVEFIVVFTVMFVTNSNMV